PPSKDGNDEKEKQEVQNLAEPTAKRQTRITPCLKNFKVICKESIFHSNKTPQVSLVFAIISTLPSIEPKDSLIMGDEHLNTFSAEEIVLIPRESEDTSRSDSKNVLPSCDDFSSINVPRDDSVTFSNPLFEFDVNFNSSEINPLFDEVLEDIECDIEILLHHDPSTPMKSIASILEGFIDDPPFEENDDLFDLECKTNDWKRILYDAPIDEAECFDPWREHEDYINRMSLLCGNSSSRSPENFHTIIEDSDSNMEEIDICFGPDDSIPSGGGEINVEVDDSFTFVTRTFLLYLTYPEVSPLLSSIKNEDTIFDPGIST
ncbi:hypothetical protein Tco_1065876, partial [Tanacetum coccineum]